MKIALCFSGLPRHIELSYFDIRRYFIDGNDVDIYGHFWWNNSWQGKINRLHVAERFKNKDLIQEFIKFYNPKKIINEDLPDFDPNNINVEKYSNHQKESLYDKLMRSFVSYTYYTRYLSMKKVNDLVLDSTIKYDMIVHLRPDLMLDTKINSFKREIENLNTNMIYFPSTKEGGTKYGGEHFNRLGDWIFCGTMDLITSFVNNNLTIILDKNNKIPLHNQERLLYFGEKGNIQLDKFNSSILIRRFAIEEWINPDYRLSLFIKPEFYIDQFDKNKYHFKEHELLPFYTKNIIQIIK